MTQSEYLSLNKSEYMETLFMSLPEDIQIKLQKLQAILNGLNELYKTEVNKLNNKESFNNAKITAALASLSRLDTIVLHSIFNQVDPTQDNSPLRFMIYEMSMLNFYLDPAKYPQNKDVLSKVNNINSIEELGGYLEVMNFVTYNIDKLGVFEGTDVVSSSLSELEENKNEQTMISSTNNTSNKEIFDEDGVSYKI